MSSSLKLYVKRTVPVVVAASLVASSAMSTPITYQATGVVTSVSAEITSIEVGDVYQVTVTMDDAATDTGGSPNYAYYNNPIISYSINIGAGAYSFSGLTNPPANNLMEVYDGTAGFENADSINVGVSGGDGTLATMPTLDGYSISSTRLFLVNDETDLALTSKAMPIPLPLFSAWNYSQWYLGVGDAGSQVGGTLSSLTVIPEPSSLALLGLGGLLVVRRRR